MLRAQVRIVERHDIGIRLAREIVAEQIEDLSPGAYLATRYKGRIWPPRSSITDAQLQLLRQQKGSFVPGYKPGAKLIALGLIDARENKLSNVTWEINHAGREYLRSFGSEE